MLLKLKKNIIHHICKFIINIFLIKQSHLFHRLLCNLYKIYIRLYKSYLQVIDHARQNYRKYNFKKYFKNL